MLMADPNNPPVDTTDIRDVIADGADTEDVKDILTLVVHHKLENY